MLQEQGRQSGGTPKSFLTAVFPCNESYRRLLDKTCDTHFFKTSLTQFEINTMPCIVTVVIKIFKIPEIRLVGSLFLQIDITANYSLQFVQHLLFIYVLVKGPISVQYIIVGKMFCAFSNNIVQHI